jgi:autotransporter-associated beta strand protein
VSARQTNYARALTSKIGIILFFACLATTVYGVTLTWNGGGGGNGNWNDSANWGGSGIPVNGDILVFQGTSGLSSTNNISGLTLNQILFNTGGFTLYGDAFTLTNSIMATNTSGANTIAIPITLAVTNVVIAVSNNVVLTLSGILSGSVGVTKSGLGSLTYQAGSSNPYTGTTFVSAGILQLNVAGISAFGGPLTIGDGSGTGAPTVTDLQSIEMDNTGPVTINSGGMLNLNNFSDNINASVTLAGGSIETGSGTLTLSPNSTITSGNGFDSFISGNLNNGSGTLTIQGSSGLLLIEANVSGAANIVQNGGVYTYWSGANTYSGNYIDNSSGYLDLVSSAALGNITNNLTLNGQSWVAIGGGINITNNSVAINSSFTGGALYCYGVTNSWTANFILDQACSIAVFTNCALNLVGPISGSGGITKDYPGTLTLSGTAVNTYSGTTTVAGGTLLLGKPFLTTAIPGPLVLDTNTTASLLNSFQIYNPAVPVTIYDSASLNLAGNSEWVGAMTLQGAQIATAGGTLYFSGNITVNASTVAQSVISGNLQIWSGIYAITNSGHNFSPDLVITAAISGGGTGVPGLIKAGAGEVNLAGANSFGGPITINGGDLWAQTSSSLANTNYPITVNNGGSLFLDGSGLDFGLKPLIINGAGYAFGAVFCSGSSSWEGNVTLNSSSQIYEFNNSALTLAGIIGGAGGLTEAGSGTLVIGGSSANNYTGGALVNSGSTLVLSNSAAAGAIAGNLDIYGTVQLAGNFQIAETAGVTVESTGQFQSGTFYSLIDKLQGSGIYNFGTNGWVEVGLNNGTSEFDGSFTGTGFAPGYTVGKNGTGTFTIGGNSTYTAGITHAYTGKLVVNGSQPTIPITVENAATLAGVGTVGPITDVGTVSPGNSVGILNSGNANISSAGDFTVDLAGPNLGSYSQLNVNGTVGITNATLTVVPVFATPAAVGQQFTIINNNLSDPIGGTFNSLAEGAAVNVGGYDFTISYVGGSGNDVVLTLTNVPAAIASAAVSAGNGTHVIDPNDCNSLNLVITNISGNTLNSVSATVSTTTEGVLITQPYSDYANIAAGGQATNNTPFQISTLPGFVCGSEIDLQVIVNSSGSSFIAPFVLSTGSPAQTPFRYDNNNSATLPLNGTLDSTNNVSDFIGYPLEKVTVSLWITNSNDSDLTNISLIAPDGTTILLSSANGGTGKSYGVAAAPDSDRTTFDDAASTSITSGAAPFVGPFLPQSPLAAFVGDPLPNGPWHLHIANTSGIGTLEAWSLFLYPVGCPDGGGSCEVCQPIISDAITAASAVQTNRWYRDETVSSCGEPKAWAGFGDLGTSFHYNAYTFTNTSGADACVTIELQSTNDVMAATYLGSYNPTAISNNFLGDAGMSTAQADDGVTTYSAEIPNGMEFVVVVNEVTENSGTQPYFLSLSGLPCPTPALNIQPVPPNQAHLYWPTWAGGYTLQATPSLSAPTWNGVTNEPITLANQFNVTNTLNPTNQFYRLQKP